MPSRLHSNGAASAPNVASEHVNVGMLWDAPVRLLVVPSVTVTHRLPAKATRMTSDTRAPLCHITLVRLRVRFADQALNIAADCRCWNTPALANLDARQLATHDELLDLGLTQVQHLA